MRGTGGDHGLCYCVPRLSSAINFALFVDLSQPTSEVQQKLHVRLHAYHEHKRQQQQLYRANNKNKIEFSNKVLKWDRWLKWRRDLMFTEHDVKSAIARSGSVLWPRGKGRRSVPQTVPSYQGRDQRGSLYWARLHLSVRTKNTKKYNGPFPRNDH